MGYYDFRQTGAELQDILNKADTLQSDGTSVRGMAIPAGKVDDTSTSTAFTATVPGITALTDGVCCYLMNGVVTSASGFTLDINNTGALPVYQTMAAASRSTTIFNVNYTMLFVYNSQRVEGGCWDVYYGYDSNTNTIGYQIRRNNGTYTAKAAVYRYMLLLSYSETQLLPVNSKSNTTGTTKPLTTEKFNPWGPIFYYGSTTAVTAGSAIAVASVWEQYTLDLRYSFNTGSTLVNNKDVFIVCEPQSDGMVKLAASPISQTLPTTADGKVYILLGHAYSTTSIVLALHHPVFYYNQGLKIWTGVGIDTVPTEGSMNPITSGAVYAALQEIRNLIR